MSPAFGSEDVFRYYSARVAVPQRPGLKIYVAIVAGLERRAANERRHDVASVRSASGAVECGPLRAASSVG